MELELFDAAARGAPLRPTNRINIIILIIDVIPFIWQAAMELELFDAAALGASFRLSLAELLALARHGCGL